MLARNITIHHVPKLRLALSIVIELILKERVVRVVARFIGIRHKRTILIWEAHGFIHFIAYGKDDAVDRKFIKFFQTYGGCIFTFGFQ